MVPAEDQPHTGIRRSDVIGFGDFPYRVLLTVPDARTIPIFALGVEAGRESYEAKTSVDQEALSRATSGNLSRTLIGGRYGEFRLINSRRRVNPRMAVYTSWLAVPEQVQAETFVRDHPRYGLNAIETKIRSDHTKHEADLRVGAEKGRYDLGHLEHRARLNRAREYVCVSEEMDRLSWHLWGLQTLKESLTAMPDGVSVG